MQQELPQTVAPLPEQEPLLLVLFPLEHPLDWDTQNRSFEYFLPMMLLVQRELVVELWEVGPRVAVRETEVPVPESSQGAELILQSSGADCPISLLDYGPLPGILPQ